MKLLEILDELAVCSVGLKRVALLGRNGSLIAACGDSSPQDPEEMDAFAHRHRDSLVMNLGCPIGWLRIGFDTTVVLVRELAGGVVFIAYVEPPSEAARAALEIAEFLPDLERVLGE